MNWGHRVRLLSLGIVIETLAVVSACSSTDGVSPDPTGDAGVDSSREVGADAPVPDGFVELGTDADLPDQRVDVSDALELEAASGPSCEEIRRVIGPSIDKALPSMGSKDVAVAVRTDSCESVTYFAGPSGLRDDMVFRMGSVTKTYVATVILGLAVEGKLNLDDTIERYHLGLPNETKITIRQLLNHTSGLYNYTSDPAFKSSWTPDERLQSAASHEVYFEPGKGWRYSNSNYIALGMIVLGVLGEDSFAQVVRSRVLVPFGLGHTYFEPEESFNEPLAPSFSKTGGVPELLVAWVDGGMVSTLADATKWMHTFASGNATPTLRDELLDGVPAFGNGAVSYGLGVMILSKAATGDVPSYGHGGDVPGFHSQVFWFPERGYTIAAVVNQDGGDSNVPMIALMDALNTIMPRRDLP